MMRSIRTNYMYAVGEPRRGRGHHGVKRFVLGHYEEHLEAKFHASHLAGNLDAAQVDWEAAYSIHHRPETNIADFTEISPATRYAAVVYIT